MAYIGNSLEAQRISPAVDTFSGNGSATTFTLSRQVVSNYGVEAYVNDVAQNPNSAFSINASNQIVFTSAPSAGTNNIYVRYNGYIGQYVGIGQGTVGTSALGSISNINSIASNLTLETNGIDAVIIDQSQNVVVGTGAPALYSKATVYYSGLYNSSTRRFLDISGDFAGTNAGSATNAGATTGIRMGYPALPGKYAIIGAISEDPLGYARSNGLTFQTSTIDAAPIERMRITAEGYIRAPYQPAFYAYEGGITTTVGPFVFTTTRLNVGGHYNTGNGRFTAPVAGNYMFFGHGLHRGNNTTANIELTFYKNGANINSRGMAYSVNSSSSGHTPVQTTALIPLAAGDYVQFGASVITSGSDIYLPSNLSHFAGYLLG